MAPTSLITLNAPSMRLVGNHSELPRTLRLRFGWDVATFAFVSTDTPISLQEAWMRPGATLACWCGSSNQCSRLAFADERTALDRDVVVTALGGRQIDEVAPGCPTGSQPTRPGIAVGAKDKWDRLQLFLQVVLPRLVLLGGPRHQARACRSPRKEERRPPSRVK